MVVGPSPTVGVLLFIHDCTFAHDSLGPLRMIPDTRQTSAAQHEARPRALRGCPRLQEPLCRYACAADGIVVQVAERCRFSEALLQNNILLGVSLCREMRFSLRGRSTTRTARMMHKSAYLKELLQTLRRFLLVFLCVFEPPRQANEIMGYLARD